MNSTDTSRGKQDRIVDILRQRIIDGHWLPGERLPSNKLLQDEFKITAVTIGRVTRRLIEDGYIYSKARSGVFVVDQPPHWHRFALAFHSRPGDRNWSAMEEVLYSLCQHGVPGLDCQFLPYFDIEPGQFGTDAKRLREDLANHRVGGIFFATDPWKLYGLPYLEHDLPKAAVMEPKADDRILAYNFVAYLEPAAICIALHDCKRVAIIQPAQRSEDAVGARTVEAQLARHGLTLQPALTQYAHTDYPESAAQIVRLLLELPADRRPDGLIVGDDNLTEAVERTLLAEGIKPEDFTVVAHSNFPASSHLRWPILRIGYDLRDLLRQVAAGLRARSRQQEWPVLTRMTAILEDDCQQSWSAAHPPAAGSQKADTRRSLVSR